MNRLELRDWRKRRWLSQRELAELLGVRKITVFRWESGESTISPFLQLALDQLDYLHYWSPNGTDSLPRLEPVSA